MLGCCQYLDVSESETLYSNLKGVADHAEKACECRCKCWVGAVNAHMFVLGFCPDQVLRKKQAAESHA